MELTPANPLSPGSPVPKLSIPDQNQQTVSLSDYLGRKFILYFYAKDGSGTCLKEAINFRDNFDVWRDKGYEIIGVSPDTAKSHLRFIQKQELPFTLLADTDQQMAQAFGVWGEKKMYGRTYMGIHRTTFVVDETGIITHVITKVKSADHTNQLLETMGV